MNWYKNYDPGVPHTIDPDQYTSYVQIIEQMFEQYPDNPMFINFDKSLTFKQVDILSQCFAGYLQSKCGCVKGERIAMLMLNTLQYPVAIFGALRAGIVVVGISPLSKPAEVNRILNETEPTCVLVLSNLAPVLESALLISPTPSVKQIIVAQIGDLLGFFKGNVINIIAKHKSKTANWHLPNAIRFNKTIQAHFQKVYVKPQIDAHDIAFLSHTNGRDAPLPKCVVYTHRNVVAQYLQLSSWFNPFFETPHEGAFLAMMPMYHLAIIISSLVACGKGYPCSLTTNARDIPAIIEDLANHKYFGTMCISRLLKALLLNDELRKVDFSNFEFIAGWGGFFSIDMIRWKSLTGRLIMEGYGTREIQVSALNPFSIKNFNNKIGLPLPSTEAKICDELGNELPINTRGELWIRGPQVMKEYWKNPELTKATLTEDAWFRTDDIMTMDDEGYLSFVDRKADVIMTPSGPVYPSDIEVVIAFMEGIQEVAVTAFHSKQLGKIIKAFIVKSAPINENQITSEDVKVHCIKYLLPNQVPDEVEFRTELPKTDMGYLFRRLLREESEY